MCFDVTFGEWLWDELTQKQVSRKRLAEAAQVHVSTVSLWINNQTRPHAKHCDAVARVLNLPRNEVRRRAGRPELQDALDETPGPYEEPPAENGIDDRRVRLVRKMAGFTDAELSLIEVVVDQIRRTKHHAAQSDVTPTGTSTLT